MYGSPYAGSPDVSLVRSLLSVGRILALVIAVLGIVALALNALAAAAFSATFGYYSAGYFVGFGYYGIMIVVNLLAFFQLGPMLTQFEQGQYVGLRERMVIWAILTLIFGVLVGILLLIAYVKLEEVQRAGVVPMPAAPGPMASAPAYAASPYGTPPYPAAPGPAAAAPAPMAAPPSPPPAPASNAPQVPNCPRCGRPATWIPQYNRWYCYADSQYL
ncbi:MAG: hypothetical protein L3K23_03940 [Thermoplasmata archaeon]|nr:hypothetical protein [Thermoplasmata archaeon]